MSKRIQFRCIALFFFMILSSTHVALAQGYGGFGGYGRSGANGPYSGLLGFSGYGGYGGYRGLGGYSGYGYGGRSNYLDSGIGAFGGGTYPGRAFGYNPQYLASRAFTAGGTLGGLTYGSVQPAELMATFMPPAVLCRAATTTSGSPDDMVVNGETAFRSGDYLAAIKGWKTALDAGPHNPVLVMLLGQAYFAAGSYGEATVTTEAAMHALPQDRWGIVVSNRSELYGNPKSYLFQLERLENAVHKNPEDPAQRFLLAYHYAYLGYPQPAVAQLDKVVELEPRDEMAVQLRKAMAPRLPDPRAPMITPGAVTSARGRKSP